MADDMKPDPQTSLYETDFYAWTQQQAERLRRASVEVSPESIDWRHVAEEIEDMGKRDRNGYRSALRNIIVHLFKLACTRSEAVKGHWRAEIRTFRSDAEDFETAAIRNLVSTDLETLHLKASAIAADAFASEEPDTPVDTTLRWTLEQILGEADDPLDA